MHKIVRRIINHKYTSIDPHMIVEGSILTFDCYIKRFDDFVIIIESGTLITSDLAHKVRQNDKLYITLDDKEAFYSYQKIHGLQEEKIIAIEEITLQSVLPQVMKLPEKFDAAPNAFKKIELVYHMSALLMEAIFNEENEHLPLSAVEKCIHFMVEAIEWSELAIMPNLLQLMPDEYTTHHHSTNVAFFSVVLGKSIGLPKVELNQLAYAALLHDIGKIRIDQALLLKPSSLDEQEFNLIQTHSEVGVEILQKNGVTTPKILDAVLYHHEKLDGQGYPKGLRGKQIPKFARIIGICDVFDALTARRTYRVNYSSYEALLLMKQQMAHQFDEHYSDTFIRLLASKEF